MFTLFFVFGRLALKILKMTECEQRSWNDLEVTSHTQPEALEAVSESFSVQFVTILRLKYPTFLGKVQRETHYG